MKLIIVKLDADSDWYTIERAEHENKRWTKPVKFKGYNGTVAMYSGRISYPADVEGSGHEMLQIASAIETGYYEHFKRCAVAMVCDRVFLWSPRNSWEPGECTYEEAQELAKDIRLKIRPVVD